MRTNFIIVAVAGLAAAGCSNNSPLLQTSAIPSNTTVAAAPRVDPACTSLASQIDNLRKDASIEKLEKAATGKTSSVQVKRASLTKQAELNKANADFQAKCGPAMPAAQTAQVAPAAVKPAPAN